MTRSERAKELFLSGYNCSQALMLAFEDLLGLSHEQIERLALPMGGGMGRLRLTCGGVSGAALCMGLLFPEKDKNEVYSLVQGFVLRFLQRCKSVNCGELLRGAGIEVSTSPQAEERTAEFYKKRPCAFLIGTGAELLEELLKEHGKI